MNIPVILVQGPEDTHHANMVLGQQISVDSSGVHAECPESGQNYIALYSVCTQCLVNLSLFRIEYPLD